MQRKSTNHVKGWQIVLTILMAWLALSVRPAEAQIWAYQPSLTGGTSASQTVNEGQWFTYTVYCWDKDTSGGQQYFDSSVYNIHSISSMYDHNQYLQSDNLNGNGQRVWEIAGHAIQVTASTYKVDSFSFDDEPSDPDRNPPGAGDYSKVVYINNVN